MNTPPVIRLHLFFARDNDLAVILRQGPSEVFRMILWDRSDDSFTDGQWVKHKVYVERCSLSADARHFLYFMLDGKWDSAGRGSYTAISRPPYFTALALFPQGDTWGGGGEFLDARHYRVYTSGKDIIGRADDVRQVFDGKVAKDCQTGLRLANGKPAPLDKPAREALLGRVEVPQANPLDAYDTQGGCLYRRQGGELTLIRDFTDMQFEAIRAPYDWRGEEDDMPTPWHPLDGERR